MLGLFAIIKGFDQAHNAVCENSGVPKHIDLHAGFSRDGFHFSRDNRSPFIRCTDRPGSWARGYLHACGGLCLVSPEELAFPIAGFSGASSAENGNLYGGAATGFARLRRDGFASLHANGTRQFMLTRKMRFEEGRLLFINANATEGFVRAQIEDEEGRPIPGYSFGLRADDCRQSSSSRGGDLSARFGVGFGIRFELIAADLFAFCFMSRRTREERNVKAIMVMYDSTGDI